MTKMLLFLLAVLALIISGCWAAFGQPMPPAAAAVPEPGPELRPIVFYWQHSPDYPAAVLGYRLEVTNPSFSATVDTQTSTNATLMVPVNELLTAAVVAYNATTNSSAATWAGSMVWSNTIIIDARDLDILRSDTLGGPTTSTGTNYIRIGGAEAQTQDAWFAVRPTINQEWRIVEQ